MIDPEIDANNQYTYDSAFNASYGYDANGNRTSRIDTVTWRDIQYVYDARNRLTDVIVYDDSNNTNDQFTGPVLEQTHYLYDGANRMVGRLFDNNGDGTYDQREVFAYDGNQIVMRFMVNSNSDAGASDLKDRYLWAPAVDQLLADEQVTSLGSAGTVSWAFTDQENTVRDVAQYDSGMNTTSVVDHNAYDAFGVKISQSSAANDILFGYTGKLLDTHTKLQYNGNRWYDPANRRFISEDPLGFEGGDSNLYRYVGNSPTNGTDPTGLTVR